MSLIEISRIDRHHHEHHTTAKEVRAPTDESVRLLREMEDKARESVLKAVRVKDCAIDMVVHTNRDHLGAQKQFACIYSVNGNRRKVITRINDWATQEEAIDALTNDLAKDIAIALLSPCIGNAMRLA